MLGGIEACLDSAMFTNITEVTVHAGAAILYTHDIPTLAPSPRDLGSREKTSGSTLNVCLAL